MTDPAPPPRRAAVLVLEDERVARTAEEQLAGTGHEVLRVSSISEALSASLSRPVTVAVADAVHARGADGADLVRALGHLRPGGHVLVAHPEPDVAGMWATFRSGGTPWVLPDDERRRLVLPLEPAPAPLGGGELALEALHEEVLGRHAEACTVLARLVPDDTGDAVEALVEAGAAALGRLHDRARYPVSTRLLVAQLPDHVGTLDGDAFSWWWAMVESIAFRAGGLRLEPPETEVDGNHRAQVCGAFHAAAVILRFTARRHWRRPVELLGDLGRP